MSRFEYVTPCPECQKENVTASIGFETDTGKFECNGPNKHSFEEIPGESASGSEPEKVPSTREVAKPAPVEYRDFTPEEGAALDEAMKRDPRPRDFSSMVVEPTQAEIVAPGAQEMQERALDEGGTVTTADQGYGLPQSATLHRPEVGTSQPMVAEAGSLLLDNNDMLVGVRIPETWVSALQSAAESNRPPLTFGQYVQERINDGLLAWFSPAPSAR